jgi:hypothetical protein
MSAEGFRAFGFSLASTDIGKGLANFPAMSARDRATGCIEHKEAV